MTDNQSEDPRREVQRLAAELARKERENDELKQDLARTKDIQDDIWSHEIYLKARRKMAGGVFAVVGVLSALGLVSAYELYERGLDYVDGEMKTAIASRIGERADGMAEEAGVKMDAQISELIRLLIADHKVKMDAHMAETQQIFAVTLTENISEAKRTVTELVKKSEDDFKDRLKADEDAFEEDFKNRLKLDEDAFEDRFDLKQAIDGLDAAKAKALITDSETGFPSIIPFVALQYPDNVRDGDADGSKAKKLLRRLVVMTVKEPEDGRKWQTAIAVIKGE